MQIGKTPLTRPFSPRSIWNIGQPGGTSYSALGNGVYSGATSYAIGDLVYATTPGSLIESYMYVSLTGGSGKTLPTGATSNADWKWVAIGLQAWDDGIPIYEAMGGDPLWTLGFNPNAWGLLSDGTWASMSDNDIWATCTPTMSTDYNSYSTTTIDGSGDPPTPPAFGTYHAKGSRNPFPVTMSVNAVHAPAGISPSTDFSDWTIVIVQPDGTVLELFAAKVLSGYRIACGSYARTNPEQSGDGVQNGLRASMIPGYAGVITTDELNFALAQADQAVGPTSTEVIPHKVGLLVPKELLTLSGGPFKYPANAADSQADAGSAYTGTKLLCGQGLNVASTASAGAEFGYFFGDRKSVV